MVFCKTTSITTSTCNNTQYGSQSNLYWIMDIGATDYMSKSPLSQNKLDTNHDFLELPNGGQAKIKLIGLLSCHLT